MKITKDTKIYINQYGIFFEGQILEQYDCHKCYLGKAELKKFIVHYRKTKNSHKTPKLYFCMSKLYKTQTFTLSVELLGIYYKACKTK